MGPNGLEQRSNSVNSRDNSQDEDRNNEVRESLADRKSIVAKSTRKLRSQAHSVMENANKKMNQDVRKKVSLRLKRTVRQKNGEDGAFDTKSIVSQRSMISNQ